MSLQDNFLAHWYYHLPNLAMAAMMYTLFGRYVLELVFSAIGGRQDAVVLKAFRGITDPLLRVVRVITPHIVPDGLVIVFTVAWLLALRMVWFLTCVAFGMRLKVGV
jgi:p-aminobenzoyl-glutamate transporter AbgT